MNTVEFDSRRGQQNKVILYMISHNYHRQLTPSERIAAALFNLHGEFTATHIAELAGVSKQGASEFLRAQEHLGVVTVVDETSPVKYQRSDVAPDSRDNDSCDWCTTNQRVYNHILPNTPSGDYLGLSDSESIHLCDECHHEVSTIINGKTTTIDGLEVLPIHPICQADGCTHLAVSALSSENGHPHEKWRLCFDHYEEVNGLPPRYPLGHNWTVRKLYYRCPSGGKISHNQVSEELDGRYNCSCGYVHIGVSVGE